MIAPARSAAETHETANRPGRLASAALMPLAEAVGLLTGRVAPVPVHSIAVSDAIGRIAGSDIRAERDSPLHASALRDGWAARADDIFGATPYAPILLTRPLAWVESGAPMPDGTDVVLPSEALEGRAVVADAPSHDGVRAAGEEIAHAACLIAAGARISPLHRLALDVAGLSTVQVRIPSLRLVVTGAAETQSLSAFIATLAAAEGATVTDVVGVPDAPDAIAAALRASDSDATFLLGGTGFGQDDQSAAGLARAGIVLAHGIALKPGGTAGFGEVDGRPVLMLPGHLDAALSAFLTLGRPLLAALAGGRSGVPRQATLLRRITSTIGLSEIVFARREPDGILPLGGADLPLRRLIEADAAILVAPEAEGYPAGASVGLIPL